MVISQPLRVLAAALVHRSASVSRWLERAIALGPVAVSLRLLLTVLAVVTLVWSGRETWTFWQSKDGSAPRVESFAEPLAASAGDEPNVPAGLSRQEDASELIQQIHEVAASSEFRVLTTQYQPWKPASEAGLVAQQISMNGKITASGLPQYLQRGLLTNDGVAIRLLKANHDNSQSGVMDVSIEWVVLTKAGSFRSKELP